jgi:hypothetical protein
VFGFGQEFSVPVLLDQVAWTSCPAKTIASQFVDNKQTVPVTKTSCENIQKNGKKEGSQSGYTYSLSCSVSSDAPTLTGKAIVTSTPPSANQSTGASTKQVNDSTDFVKLTNPIGGKKDNPAGQTNINALVGTVIKQARGIIGSITFFVFVYGGFLWLTSAGNSDQVKKGSETMLWAGIGVCIIFASYAILQFVITALGS